MTVVPPGVDVGRFTPMDAAGRVEARRSFGLPLTGPLIVSVSRLVPRKGMDVLIDATAALAPDHPRLTLAIAGGGRDRQRLVARIRRTMAPARLLGRVEDPRLPSLYAAADIFAMVCRDRWAGLEAEGFGIVFLEAAAAGVPQVAGDSGGSAEAVQDGVTGVVVGRPRDAGSVAAAIASLLDDPTRRAQMGVAARARAEAEFTYDGLAARLGAALRALSAGPAGAGPADAGPAGAGPAGAGPAGGRR
jgi:phosphatidylinositol alpha-1,6-mannosyltransferase